MKGYQPQREEFVAKELVAAYYFASIGKLLPDHSLHPPFNAYTI